MAMEVPAPPQGVIGSVCGWLYGVFGPGNIKQDHIRTLCSTVIRVIFYYCDDFITGQCLISATPAWGYLLRFLQGAAAAIWILHITIPTSPTPAEAKGDASSASNVALSDQLERLARLHEQRLLTADEFALAKKVALLDLGNELKAQGRPSPKKARVREGTGRSRSPPPATDASASAGYD